ncbi:tripartite ATP-independent transporter DctP family solute receptor [Salsuginibacillus halophilus]|uniref:Tripartite ATP-independent transporter DctP family solute receptor n=1 Tax=Salsuginibacillus halophilus TaxID=517424 RepID=A0A2P8HQV5_9BACI|nr:TRAP transporter substrate-binding protein [Salsuginibacillus halophilus]PSL48596.1 tripartite ATP-independent transporter DctP family solute receptor [Salsuginibacillus halophilus]
MNKHKRFVTIAGATGLAVMLSACGGFDDEEADNGGDGGDPAEEGDEDVDEPEDAGDAEVTLRLAHSASEDHQYNIAAEHFQEEVAEQTDGDVAIEIHGNATLGGEGEAIEQVLDGSLAMTTVAADSNLANTVSEMNLFGIPYIFEDEDHVYDMLDGDLGDDMLGMVGDNGMVGMGYWEVGMRHITNSQQEIESPEDMDGLSIRVQPSPVWEAHMNALGASPTPVDFDELYSSLDQGVVDGQENPLPTIDSMNFYEVQEYVSLTGHTYTPAVVLMSEDAQDELGEHFEDVQAAVEATTEFHRDELSQMEDDVIERIEDAGVTITEEVDHEAFLEATEDVREEVSDDVPSELVDRVLEHADD